MASRLYPSLKTAIASVVSSYSPAREPVQPILSSELKERLSEIWSESSVGLNASESSSKSGDVVRTVLEVIGRDVVVLPITSGELAEADIEGSKEDKQIFQTSLQDRLDVVLTLFEVVYAAYPDLPALEPGALFIPLLEELVELISVDSWRELWTYVETRSKRFTKDMPASRGKALPLLRTINAFLRFLPRTPENLVFRGRVHQFASSVISVADKSAINMRGDYAEVRTTWDEEEIKGIEDQEQEEVQDGEGDVKMDMDDNDEKKIEVEAGTSSEQDLPSNNSVSHYLSIATAPQMDFYPTLWSLQQYFAHPPSLDGIATGEPPKTPFDTFKEKSDFVLPQLFAQTQKEKALLGKDTEIGGKKRKRSAEDEGNGGFFHPRFLTGKRLLEHELADPSFRRQILVQYFILFQFLLNLTPASAGKQAFTGGMPKTFVLGTDDEKWVISKIQIIRDELTKMEDGKRFEETVLSIITREVHYAQWKNDQCPEGVFEIPPLEDKTAKDAAKAWEKRLAPPASYTFKVGSRPLSMLWNNGFRGIDQLKGREKATSEEQLDEEIQKIVIDEEDDKAMGREQPQEEMAANKDRKTSLTWRGLRLASHHHLRYFGVLAPKRDIHVLLKATRGETDSKGPAVENQVEAEKNDDDNGQEVEVAGDEDGKDEPSGEDSAMETIAEQPAPQDTVKTEDTARDVDMNELPKPGTEDVAAIDTIEDVKQPSRRLESDQANLAVVNEIEANGTEPEAPNPPTSM
ncbi:uncharacterized protein IL334_006715 [Kwoniella shivajii]|uniref:THO complex subunit 1 n=1 Tax=Kwoniella shivajii TaxID=564305 RepID=A0ABZ1D8P4_9TREE|nr:hypothetical protein IL334_006715 [Kwoniella shivajii]